MLVRSVGRTHVPRPLLVSFVDGLKQRSDLVQLVTENDLSEGPESTSQEGSSWSYEVK